LIWDLIKNHDTNLTQVIPEPSLIRIVWKNIMEDHQYALGNHQEINYCMVFKNQNGTRQVKHPRSQPFLASNTIKKREWYIHFLINYDNNWLPVKTNLNIFNVDETIKCCSKVILCFLYFEIKKNIIFRKVSN
jgi:hypothetical protein